MFHAAVLLDGSDVVSNFQTPTPTYSYLDCLLAVSDDVTTLQSKAPVHRPTGIALHIVILDKLTQNAPLGCLNRKVISLGREIVIVGYGTCFTLYEALYGAGHDAETLFSMHINANCTGVFLGGGR